MLLMGKFDQAYFMKSFLEVVTNGINAETITVIVSAGTIGNFQWMIFPKLFRDLQGRPVCVIRNASNQKREFALIKIGIETLSSFFSCMDQKDKAPDEWGSHKLIPGEFLQEIDFLGKKTIHDAMYPCFIPFYANFEPPCSTPGFEV